MSTTPEVTKRDIAITMIEDGVWMALDAGCSPEELRELVEAAIADVPEANDR